MDSSVPMNFAKRSCIFTLYQCHPIHLVSCSMPCYKGAGRPVRVPKSTKPLSLLMGHRHSLLHVWCPKITDPNFKHLRERQCCLLSISRAGRHLEREVHINSAIEAPGSTGANPILLHCLLACCLDGPADVSERGCIGSASQANINKPSEY